MKSDLLGLMAVWALLGSTVAANASPYVVTLEEAGANVVATGGGAIDLTDLTMTVLGGCCNASGLDPQFGYLAIGSLGGVGDGYTGSFSGPSSFGSGTTTAASSGSGDPVEFDQSVSEIVVPTGYVSDTPLSDGFIYNNATFANLGVTPGTYVWTWGTRADRSFTLEIGTTPLPAALPLFASGLGAMGLLGWRRKRKNAAALAAA